MTATILAHARDMRHLWYLLRSVNLKSPCCCAVSFLGLRSMPGPNLRTGLRGWCTSLESHFCLIDWCCFYYFVRISLVSLLEAPCARICSWDLWISGVFLTFFFLCVCKVSNKAFFPPPETRLLCLVVSIPLVCWLHMCACVRVSLYVHVKICR